MLENSRTSWRKLPYPTAPCEIPRKAASPKGRQRPYTDPVPFAPVQGHKEQNQTSAPLPKMCRTENPGRTDCVLQDPQHHITLNNDYYSLKSLQLCSNLLTCLLLPRIRRWRRCSWHLMQPAKPAHNMWQRWPNCSKSCLPHSWDRALGAVSDLDPANCSMATQGNSWWDRIPEHF